jgi:hypothetical protein
MPVDELIFAQGARRALLAWIIEKFRTWADCDGHPENVFTRDQLLTNVMLYWTTGTITSSARLYWEMQHAGDDPAPFVDVPTGLAVTEGDPPLPAGVGRTAVPRDPLGGDPAWWPFRRHRAARPFRRGRADLLRNDPPALTAGSG